MAGSRAFGVRSGAPGPAGATVGRQPRAKRSATTASKSRRRSGDASITASKSAFESDRALMSVAAVTVAVRGRSARIAISPTNHRAARGELLTLRVRRAGHAVDDQEEAIAGAALLDERGARLERLLENFDETASTSSGRRWRNTRGARRS